jgi:hypothetical protein
VGNFKTLPKGNNHPIGKNSPKLGPIFRTFFPGKIFPQKCWEKIEFSAEKSFEKSFFQQIPRNFPQKVIFRGKKCTKNRPLVTLDGEPEQPTSILICIGLPA